MKNDKKGMSLQEKLTHRVYKKPSVLVTGIYDLVGSTVLLPKYNPHFKRDDDISKETGPCFLIWNHLSRLDHLYTMKLAYPARYNMVAGYNEFFRSHLHTVFTLNHIVPKKIFANDKNFIRAVNSVIKRGGIVTFSPEGMSSIYGTNQPIVPGTGRFLKHYNIPVYCVDMRGQYLTSTKHFLQERKGRTEARIYKLFTPEQLQSMTGDEIDDKINEVFRHDDYEWGQKNHIRYEMHGNSCEHLDEICYRCPRCGKELTMRAEKDTIVCSSCGNGARMNDYYEFEPFDDTCVLPVSPSKWVEEERVQTIREIRADESYSFSENVTVGYIPEDHYIKNKQTSEECGKGVLTADHKGIHFKGVKHGKEWNFDLSYLSVFSLVIVTSTAQFALFVDNNFYEFTPSRRSVGKLLLLVEEMHRLHYNIWKNFKWNDWMYEGLQLGIDRADDKK